MIERFDYEQNIIDWGIPSPIQEYTVVILCTTYNHERYIEDALKGFVSQQTDFPFCAIIIDDASKDNTAEIIRRYERKHPDIIKGFYLRENHYQKKISQIPYYIKWFNSTKYVAFCEGDDYWIDPYKLQKQVDFLNNNRDYSLVHSYYRYVNEDKTLVQDPSPKYKNMRARVRNGYVWGYYLRNQGFILTCTTCIRMPFNTDEKNILDRSIFMSCARVGKVYCIKEETSAYRRSPNGAMLSSKQGHLYNLTVRVWLYQMYYYHQNGHSKYYEDDKETSINRAFALIHIIKAVINGSLYNEDKKVLFTVIRKEFINFSKQLPHVFFEKIGLGQKETAQ